MATLRIGDESLTPAALAAAAREEAVSVELTPAARERMAAGRAAVDAVVAAGQPVYARTTGVGANYDVAIQEKGRDHSLRLLRLVRCPVSSRWRTRSGCSSRAAAHTPASRIRSPFAAYRRWEARCTTPSPAFTTCLQSRSAPGPRIPWWRAAMCSTTAASTALPLRWLSTRSGLRLSLSSSFP